MNPYQAQLSLISACFEYDILVEVLFQLNKTAEHARSVATVAAKSVGIDVADSIWEDTGELVEALYGAAFVVCQASLTGVVSRVIALHKFTGGKGKPLASVPNRRIDLLLFGSTSLSSTSISAIQSVEAFANYFKHHDEWPRGWTGADPHQKATIDALAALGFSYGSSHILTNAMKLFGADMLEIANLIASWHKNIHFALHEELFNLGLI